MTRDQSWHDLCTAARHAWDTVPHYLRTTRTARPWGSTRVEFSDRRRA